MSVNWNDILKLPEATLAGDMRVPKTQIVKQGELNRTQEGMLGKLRDIRFFASLTKSNSYIQPVKDETYDVGSVIFLTCGLNSTKGISDALRIVHGCFPNPTVILAEGHANPGIAVSVAIRRKSQAEHGAFVTETVQSSGLFDPDELEYQPYLERLAYQTLPQTTLLDYVRILGDRTILAYTVRTLGYYPVCEDSDAVRLMGLVKEMNVIASKINELQEMRKSKNAALSETTKLRVEIRKLELQRDGVKNQIEELCL